MGFTTPDFQAIRDGILRDIQNQPLPDGKLRNVSSDGDYYVRANANGSAIEGLYQHQAWIAKQIFPDSSDPDYLERHAARRGLALKSATLANGAVAFYGTVGSPVPIGTEAKIDGVAYVTTVSSAIGADGTATIASQASSAGVSGNQVAGVSLTLTSAPSGVQSTATIVSMTGGTDVETYPSLLSRLLFVLRNPPCGGAAHDYYTWAMNVPGVTAAYPYPQRRGIGSGTIDVAILTAGGIPGPEIVAAAQAAIDAVRPVQGDCIVLAPTPVPVNLGGTLSRAAGYTLAAVEQAIDTARAAYLASLKPGDTAYLHRLRNLVSNTAGVVDFDLSSPATNVATLVDATHVQLAVPGTQAWL